MTVALALVPEAIAFAFVCHVSPMLGLYAAMIMGLLTAVFGGRPGMISGATGAVAVVYASLVMQHSVEYLFAAVLLAGLLQITAGILRLGKFVRLIPHPVMLGFVNGLAIVIFLAQRGQFKTLTALPDGSGTTLAWLQGRDLGIMVLMVGVTMAICHFMPKLTKAVPSSLVAIVVMTLASIGLAHAGIYEGRTVIDFVNMNDPGTTSLQGGFPVFHLPQVAFNWETLRIIFPYSALAASVGLIESLLTLTLIDEQVGLMTSGFPICINNILPKINT